ncbi:MAG: hypothetical protein ACOX5R_11660 [bacterium]|jgi:hypothetical protein
MTEVRNFIFQVDEQVTFLPVVHGSGDFALRVRQELLHQHYDCIAVPLPPSFRDEVIQAVDLLPIIHVVAASEPEEDSWNYVPVEPCQPVIMAIRLARQEYTHIEFIDQETPIFEPEVFYSPDPYALKKVPLEKYCAAILPSLIPPEPDSQLDQRIRHMAQQLHALREKYQKILCICSISHWLWLRDAYQRRLEVEPAEEFFSTIITEPVKEKSLAFVLGELPFITYLYVKAQRELLEDENLSIDGIKELFIQSREEWLRKENPIHNWVTPQLLQVLLQYVRNLTLMNSRLTPDLYTLALAARQVCGDTYTISLIETAKQYPYQHVGQEGASFGVNQVSFLSGGGGEAKNRLQGFPVQWRNLPLKRMPDQQKQKKWKQRWNPFGICSWPPEDRRIESFNTHVREAAQAMIGEGLVKSEKFSSSVKDGLDIRETIRNWHTGDIYVKEIPPSRGTVEAVVFLFDTPADAEKYSFQTTWYAEHDNESTLSFFSTPIGEKFVGPGIAQCFYGGCMFVFPPRYIPDIWEDIRFLRYRTLEERLLAGALYYSTQKHVALVSPKPPTAREKLLARRYKKKIIYIPLSRFSQQLLDRLRVFHVLNGKHIRSYAAHFIREI